jgi:hypothetical protein
MLVKVYFKAAPMIKGLFTIDQSEKWVCSSGMVRAPFPNLEHVQIQPLSRSSKRCLWHYLVEDSEYRTPAIGNIVCYSPGVSKIGSPGGREVDTPLADCK